MEKEGMSKKINKKITKGQKITLLFTIIYMIVYTILYFLIKNYEFIIYVITQSLIIIFIGKLHLKFKFPTYILVLLSIWGFIHMSAGYFYINGIRLYDLWLIGSIIKFDMVVHFYGFGAATLAAYYVIKKDLKISNKIPLRISVFLVLIGMGLGAINEIIEFSTVLLYNSTGPGGYENTMWDIVFNTLGAIVAVVFINRNRKK